MNDRPLAGTGVLVTRPAHQAGELCDAIGAAGGHAIRFPVLRIVPRDAEAVAREVGRLPRADITVFVSPNAVQYGLAALPEDDAGLVAAIGPATASALRQAGRPATIVPRRGFDSEHLLETAELRDVAGRSVRIVRGTDGRELLARCLQQRGARVDYLPVYARAPGRRSAAELADLEARWRHGGVQFVVVMSVASFGYLLDALPPRCRRDLAAAQLVTPSERVIQTAVQRIPRLRTLRAVSPRPGDLVAAMIAGRAPQDDSTHD